MVMMISMQNIMRLLFKTRFKTICIEMNQMRLSRYYFLHKFLLMMTLGRHKCTTISNFAIINIIITTIFCDFIVTILPFIIIIVIGIITKITNTAILISHHICQKILSCSKYDGNMSQIMIDLGKKNLAYFLECFACFIS